MSGVISRRHISNKAGTKRRITLHVSRYLARSTANAVTCLRFRDVKLSSIGTRLTIDCISRGAIRINFRGTSSRSCLRSITRHCNVICSGPNGNVYRRLRLRHFNGPNGALVNSSSRAPANNNLNVFTVNTNNVSITITVNNNPFCVA